MSLDQQALRLDLLAATWSHGGGEREGAVGGSVTDPEVERYRSVAHRLHEIAKPIRLLAALRWPASVREEFLAGGGDALPSVEYPSFDEQPIVDTVNEVRRSIYPGELIDDWLESVANSVEHTARMLAARGTESFLPHSQALYGTPHTPLRYDPVTPYELAQRVHEVLAAVHLLEPPLDRQHRGKPPPPVGERPQQPVEHGCSTPARTTWSPRGPAGAAPHRRRNRAWASRARAPDLHLRQRSFEQTS